MKIKVHKIEQEFYINIPEHILEALNWEEDDNLTMEVGRDFMENATALVAKKRIKK